MFIKLKNHAGKMRDFIINTILPIECINCGLDGAWLCDKCLKKIKINDHFTCPICKTENELGQYCCEKHYLNGLWVMGDYKDPLLAKVIKNYKYHFIKDFDGTLSNLLFIYYINIANKIKINSGNHDFYKNFFKDTVVMPVPLHKKRLAWRGFHQTKNLSLKFAKKTNFQHSADLIRVRHTKPQAKLNERKRKLNIKDCFQYVGKSLNHQKIILIDDVATTGYTLNECAKELKLAGANEIWGLVLARG